MERSRTTDAQRTGDAAEELVATRLTRLGWNILARNVRLGRDEVDIVAIDPGPPRWLVAVEVRRRGRRDYGLAEESLGWRKRAALRRAIGTLLGLRALPGGQPLPTLPWRIDLVAIDQAPDGGVAIRHHRGFRP